MKITHVITRLVVGGAQENTVATVLGLCKRPGVEVNLISGPTTGPEGSLEFLFADKKCGDGKKSPDLHKTSGSFSLSLSERERAGVRVSVEAPMLTIVPELVRPVHPLKDFIALRKLEKILREQKPDIVHTHSGKAGILGRLAAKRAGVPIIIHHIHGPSFGNFQGAFANFIFTAAEKYAGRVTDHFFCSAQAMARLYLAAGIGNPSMFTRIFSGFNLQPFLDAKNDSSLREKLRIPADAFVIGKIARLFKLKGHLDLLKVFARIWRRIPRSRLLFVGDGVLRNELVNQAKILGIADKVIFAGLVTPAEVARYVGIMDCVAHLSYREALSRALPQALAAGKPVVAYDFDGADEICIENETGFLIRTGDVDAVAEKLLQLEGDAALRKSFGSRGQQFVKENFSIEKMVDDQYNLYLKLTKSE